MPLARLAALVMVGKTLDELGVTDEVVPTHYSVKESVFPFNKFPGVDIILGPEMKSTGEVMGIDNDLSDGVRQGRRWRRRRALPTAGTVFLSLAGHDKEAAVPIAKQFAEMGYKLIATTRHGDGAAESRHRRGRRRQDCRKVGRT